MIISETQPPPLPGYAEKWERSLDPWHSDAFPNEFKSALTNSSQRKEGWLLVDYFGNAIGFVLDGAPIEEASLHCASTIVIGIDYGKEEDFSPEATSVADAMAGEYLKEQGIGGEEQR